MKIVLLGDSIRIQYGPIVEGLLRADGHDVYQPQDNCRFAKYTLRLLFDQKDLINDANFICFNIGHWDLCKINEDGDNFSTIEEYAFNLKRLAKLLLNITNRVLFVTTTPVRNENPYNKNSDIILYNQTAIRVMNELNIKVFDLHSIINENIEKYISEDLIHLSKDGILLAGQSVASAIKKEIQKRN